MWKRAGRDTAKFFGWNPQTIARSVISFGIGLLVYWIWQGEAVKEEIIVSIAFGLAGVVTLAISLFIYNLIRAPVFIRFEKEKEPRLAIKGIARSHYGKKGHSWDLIIKNLGTDRADDCKGTLVGIDFAKPTEGLSMEWWPKNEQLQWAERLPSMLQEFSIPGLESRNLRVIVNELSKPQTPYHDIRTVYIAYARDELSRERSPLDAGTLFTPTSNITVDTASCILVIGITSKNAVPIYAICYLTRDYAGFGYELNLLDQKSDLPNIADCRQTLLTLSVQP